MHISAAFDSGNIEVLDAQDPAHIRLAILPDQHSHFYQWFHFRLSGAKGIPCVLRLTNASGAAYPRAWLGYQAVVSTDRKRWRRIDTRYTDGALVLRHTPEADSAWFAYFAPYSHEQHLDLLARHQDRAALSVLGQTLDGRDLDKLTAGQGPRQIWVIARQHPGESMGSWWMEGFLERLLDPDDALARKLLNDATFHIVPNMNPDGAIRGHLRTNAAGANLNREWQAPTLQRSPEVRFVRDAMDQSGVDLCLDVHGDEELPFNFIAGSEGTSVHGERLAALLSTFKRSYARANPDFQTERGYIPSAPGEANLTMCTNQIAERFDCLAMTLEMPFKDNELSPDPIYGWSPERAQRLGASALDPIAEVLPTLRQTSAGPQPA